MQDPEIIDSELSREVTIGYQRFSIEIYRLETEEKWTLEVVDEEGTSTVWDELFDSDQVALGVALRMLNEDEARTPGNGLPKPLLELGDFLLSESAGEEAMTLDELDGYLTGVIVCPDLIMPSEWLPPIWGGSDPVFEDFKQTEIVTSAIMNHYNSLIGDLDQGRFSPILEHDLDDDPSWEIWIGGYWKALSLRPDSWDQFYDIEDRDLQRALFVMGRLAELALFPPDEIEPLEIDEELETNAADIIPPMVEVIHQARKILANPYGIPANQNKTKVGRNDPCPCGSGKKFKKCCLNRSPSSRSLH